MEIQYILTLITDPFRVLTTLNLLDYRKIMVKFTMLNTISSNKHINQTK